MRGWLTDFATDAMVLEVYIRPRRSHSNSFGNDVEKDTAGCRALIRKYIVIGGESGEHARLSLTELKARLAENARGSTR